MSNHSPSSLLPSIVALVIFSIIGVIATQTQAVSPTQNLPDSSLLSSEYFEPHFQEFVFFYSKKVLSRNLVELTLPFKPATPPPILFLGFTGKNQDLRRDILISHPQISDLNWDQLNFENIHLYQRTPKFQSVAQFLSQPPNTSSIAVDPNLMISYPQFKTAAPTSSNLDLEKIDYILTTFTTPESQQDFLLVKKTIDVTDAKINDNNEIEWYLKQQNQSQQVTYWLGNINVDYLQ